MIKRITKEQSEEYGPLTLSSYRPYLSHCDQQNIIAMGARDGNNTPCGLILAVTQYDEKRAMNPSWVLCSIYVSPKMRQHGIGRALWTATEKELEERGCERVRLQSVLREQGLDSVVPYLVAMGFSEPKKVAKIFSFSKERIQESPFTRGSLQDVFQQDQRFAIRSFEELSESNRGEIEANEGQWYPEFVSPFIGERQINTKCTLFAIDPKKERVAGWVTALDVNQNTRILYRTFFTREEYRDTPIGFSLFTEAIKRHLTWYMDRGGIASIPVDNERAMRFSELFFRGAYDHISYEIEAKIHLKKGNGNR